MSENQTTPHFPPVPDAEVMRLWRECGLPEWFLGRNGTNFRLWSFAQRCAKEFANG